MNQSATLRKPISLIITCLLSLAATAFYIYLYAGFPDGSPYQRSFAILWSGIIISIHLVVAAATVLLFRQKLIGIWIWFAAKVALFAVPGFAGTFDSVVGLLTPILFLESGIFFIIFGLHVKYLR